MNIEEMQQQVDRYHAEEDKTRARLEAATSDTERLHLERHLRMMQNLQWAYLGSIRNYLDFGDDDDAAGRTEDSSLDRQARA